MTPTDRLRIHPHAILRSTRPHKRPPSIVLPHLLVNLLLATPRADQLSLRVLRLECVPVLHQHLDEPVWQVKVRRIPLLRSPSSVDEDDEHKQEIRERVSDGLVDEVGEVGQVGEGGGLGGRARGVGGEEGEERGREEDGAVPVGLEVDADVVPLGGVVKVLDSSRDAGDGKAL